MNSLRIMTNWYTSIQCVYYGTLITSIQCVYYDRLIHINTACLWWQTDTSIQSAYYGRMIHINTFRVLWHTDSPQYSVYYDRLIHINTVYYDRLIHINRVCVLWQTDTHQYSLCIMTDWYTWIESAYYDKLIHLNTVCVLWHTDTRPSTGRCSFRPSHPCCHLSVHLVPNPRYNYLHDWVPLACHTVCRTLFADGMSSVATVSVIHHKFVLRLLDVFRYYLAVLTTNVVCVY